MLPYAKAHIQIEAHFEELVRVLQFRGYTLNFEEPAGVLQFKSSVLRVL